MTSNNRVRILLLGAAVACSGCGYTLAGQGSFLPDYIRTVGIPMFENTTRVFEIERRLTQEVVTEFIGRGPYSVSSADTGVDAVLLGTINQITIRPATFTAGQQASQYVFTLHAAIEFRDLTTDETLWENPMLIFSDTYEVPSGSSGRLDASTFFGQQSNAVERITQDFAETVVSSILEAF